MRLIALRGTPRPSVLTLFMELARERGFGVSLVPLLEVAELLERLLSALPMSIFGRELDGLLASAAALAAAAALNSKKSLRRSE